MKIRSSRLGLAASTTVAVCAAVFAGVAPAHAEPEYAQEDSQTVTITTSVPGTPGTNTDCNVTAWLGISDSGYLSSYTSVSCRSQYATIVTDNRLHIKSSMTILGSDKDTAKNATYGYSGASGGKGAKGKTYCSSAIGDVWKTGGLHYTGQAQVCITKSF